MFEEGFGILQRGIEKVVSTDGVELYHVTDGSGCRTVVRRTYRDRPDEYSCDCSAGFCRHSAAVFISVEQDGSDATAGPVAIADIERDIAGMAGRVRSSPYYDESDDEYGYHDEDDYWTRDVEYEASEPIVRRIVEEVEDPHEAIRLLDMMQREIETRFEWTCGGYDEAFDDYSSEIGAMLHFADARDAARILSHGDGWSRAYAGRFPREIEDAAYAMMRSGGPVGGCAADMMFERGDYEAYVEACGRSEDAVLKAAGLCAGATMRVHGRSAGCCLPMASVAAARSSRSCTRRSAWPMRPHPCTGIWPGTGICTALWMGSSTGCVATGTAAMPMRCWTSSWRRRPAVERSM